MKIRDIKFEWHNYHTPDFFTLRIILESGEKPKLGEIQQSFVSRNIYCNRKPELEAFLMVAYSTMPSLEWELVDKVFKLGMLLYGYDKEELKNAKKRWKMSQKIYCDKYL